MTWGFVALLALFVPLYCVMAMNLATMRSSDAAGNGMAAAFAAISGIGVWIVLLFLLLGAASIDMYFVPSFFLLMALVVASLVSLTDAALGRRRYAAVILPLPFLAIAVWARLA